MNKLILIDGNSIINRAYYAMPYLTSNSGICTGGIHGFLKMLAKLIREEQPTHLACTFDLKAPTFRHKKYPDYKAGRKPMPEELAQQIPILKEILTAMNIKYFELVGYEADDLLGTISLMCPFHSLIVSGDKDVLQLASEDCTIIHTKKGISEVIRYTPQLLKEEGIADPVYITDLKGLMGDSSDNIKGVAGIGAKTAGNLIATYGNLECLYEHIDEQKGKLKEKLIEGKESAFFSRELATINRKVPLLFDWSELELKMPFPTIAYDKLMELNLVNIIEGFSFEKESRVQYKRVEITNENDLLSALESCKNKGTFTFYIGDDISFCCDEQVEYFITSGESLLDLGISFDRALELIKPILFDENIKKVLFDIKSIYHTLKLDNTIFKCDDLLLISYVSDVSKHKTELVPLLDNYSINTEFPSIGIRVLFDSIKSSLKEQSLMVYETIEKPLVEVLYEMERNGFLINVNIIEDLKIKYTEILNELQEKIWFYAGEKFNINSPKQLGNILYDKLLLKSDKKKSTGADKLEKLKDYHPIVNLVLDYRKFSKLQSTYIIGIQSLLDKNNRLHTIFKQALTTTGRLSSTEPNLQNIPVRSKEGREIRKAFIAEAGHKLVCADYSQIELRLVAAMSGDEHMISDYNSGYDIHRATAAKVFGVPIEFVTDEMRRSAKAVNFGIIYGISDFGLSENIGCSVKDARNFIDRYFESYPKVQEYMHKTVEDAKTNGYVQTLSGRTRVIPELSSPVYTVRSFGERAAMNMPLQGTASDIIKLAMIAVFGTLKEKAPQAKLLLQVHDELIVDCPESEVDIVSGILKECMEGVMELEVPLIAEVGVGDNWLEAKE